MLKEKNDFKNKKYTLLFICIAVLALCGYKMYTLPLWEWWTFPFLGALWATIVLLLLKRYNLRYLGLSTLSGVLFCIGFPPHSFPPALFFAFVPLLIIEKEVRLRILDFGFWNLKKNISNSEMQSLNFEIQSPTSKVQSPKSEIGLMRYAFNTFVIFNIGVTWWVANAGLIPGLIANYLNAFFMATAFWLYHKFNLTFDFRRWTEKENPESLSEIQSKLQTPTSKVQSLISLTVFWIGFEYLHLNWDVSWTWLTLGNAFAERTFMIQWYEYTGVFGGTIWVLWTNYLIFEWYSRVVNRKSDNTDWRRFFLPRHLKIISAIAIAIILPLLVSFFIYTGLSNTGIENKSMSVVIVQPNYEPVLQKFDVPEAVQLQKFLRLAAEKVDSNTDYLVFPETSFSFHNVNTWNEKPVVQALEKFVGRYPKLHLVLGIDAIKTYAEYVRKKPATLTASSIRTYKNPDGSFTFWEAYDAATQISNDADNLPLYKKSKLVPGPELLPFPQIFFFLEPLFEKMGGSTVGLGTQPERSVFNNAQKNLKIAPVVCYESIYGDFCTGYVRNGANALFVVTNDGWWGNTPGYRQHLLFGRLRAIELRRPLAHCANTGTSCFIDTQGNISEATKYGTDAVIKKNIEIPNNTLTFYARYGDYIGKFFAISAVFFLFIMVFVSGKKYLTKFYDKRI